MVTAVAVGTSIAWWAAPASATTHAPLAVPTGVGLTVGPSTVTVSWTVDPVARVTYVATSDPTGLTCRVVGKASCSIPDTSLTPYTFSVVASKNGYASSAPSTPTTAVRTRLVLVVAGQSNAVGCDSYATDPTTGIDYLAPPYTDGADTHDLLTWTPWSIEQGAGATPTSLDSPQVAIGCVAAPIFGPEIGIARQLWADTGQEVTIVKAAYDGTTLAVDWSPTGSGALPLGLFPATVTDVSGTMAADAAHGQLDVLGGFYWYQGESDAESPSTARAYRANLRRFIVALRRDLPFAPTAPVVLAKEDISDWADALGASGADTPAQVAALLAGNDEVRSADDWAAAHLPDVVEVDTRGLPRPAYLHLSDTSELTLGEELASASEPLLP